MHAPTNRVSHHLLQAQAIHNEVRAQRDAAIEILNIFLGNDEQPDGDLRERARRLVGRVVAYNRAEGETQL